MNQMHIKYFEINENLENNSNTLLIVENKKMLYSMLNDLLSGNNYLEYFDIFDENLKKVKFTDVIDFIPSLLMLDINQKKNINLLIRNIKNNYFYEMHKETEYIKERITSIFNNIKLNINFDIISDVDFSEEDLMKEMNISIFDGYLNILERLTNYIKVIYELRKVKCFIFYGLLEFLDEEDLKLLLLECKYMNIKVIDIENGNNSSDFFDSIYILDKDLCLIK